MNVASEMGGTPSKIHINRRARRNERKRQKEYVKKLWLKNFQNLMKALICTSKKLNRLQVE